MPEKILKKTRNVREFYLNEKWELWINYLANFMKINYLVNLTTIQFDVWFTCCRLEDSVVCERLLIGYRYSLQKGTKDNTRWRLSTCISIHWVSLYVWLQRADLFSSKSLTAVSSSSVTMPIYNEQFLWHHFSLCKRDPVYL